MYAIRKRRISDAVKKCRRHKTAWFLVLCTNHTVCTVFLILQIISLVILGPVATGCPVSIAFDPGTSNIDKRLFYFPLVHQCLFYAYKRKAYWCIQFLTPNDF